MTARAVMVLGCTSHAGKSWLATALCRWYARQGLAVRPFKAQNMSNHARVVHGPEGPGEIGSAQYFQALAAGVPPEPRMNPVLLKPEADVRSQVVLMGRVRPDLTEMPWRRRSEHLWPTALAALESLRAEADVLVLEGAGSPAEINLAASDYVNTRSALAAEAACLLVADIDRGGAFAHLYGTHALMDERVRRQVRGFVLNKFRGDASLLAPAPQQLRQLTGVPTLAVVPMRRDHGLPEEDAVPADGGGAAGTSGLPRVVVLATPHASNLDEFEPLRAAGVPLAFSRDAAVLRTADWLVLPGSKHTRADADWLRASGLAAAVHAHAASGRPLLAICGGLQLLGERLDDPQGLEGGAPGHTAGLGVLPLHTTFEPRKQLARSRHRFAALTGPWAPLSHMAFDGYEIHLGRSIVRHGGHGAAQGAGDAAMVPALLPAPAAAVASASPSTAMAGACAATACAPAQADGSGLAWQRGNVLALYLHGLFEQPDVVQALFGRRPRSLDAVFDGLADLLDDTFEPGALMALLEP